MSGTGSLAAVRDAFAAGAATLDDVGRLTGLDRDLVRLAVDRLLALGLVTSASLAVGCPDDGCGVCPSASGSCGSPPAGGVVALTLTRRPT